jgi:hypothetical protein
MAVTFQNVQKISFVIISLNFAEVSAVWFSCVYSVYTIYAMFTISLSQAYKPSLFFYAEFYLQ